MSLLAAAQRAFEISQIRVSHEAQREFYRGLERELLGAGFVKGRDEPNSVELKEEQKKGHPYTSLVITGEPRQNWRGKTILQTMALQTDHSGRFGGVTVFVDTEQRFIGDEAYPWAAKDELERDVVSWVRGCCREDIADKFAPKNKMPSQANNAGPTPTLT